MKKILAVILAIVLALSEGTLFGATNAYADNFSAAIDFSALFPYNYVSPESFVNFAKENCLGIPYVSGGRNRNGFDCCGLVYYVCKHFGIDIGKGNQRSQIKYGSPVSFSTANIDAFCKSLVPGDLIFFDYGGDGLSDHVGIYSGNKKIIQAQSPGYNSVNSNLTMTWLDGKAEYKFTCAVRRLKELTLHDVSMQVPEAVQTYPTCLTITIKQKTTIKSYPCSKATNAQSKDICKAYVSDSYNVLGLIQNTPGNYWYMVLLSSKGHPDKIGFIFAGNASPLSLHDISDELYYSLDGYSVTKGENMPKWY